MVSVSLAGAEESVCGQKNEWCLDSISDVKNVGDLDRRRDRRNIINQDKVGTGDSSEERDDHDQRLNDYTGLAATNGSLHQQIPSFERLFCL